MPKARIGDYTFNELAEHYLVWATRKRSFKTKEFFVKDLLKVFGNCPLKSFSTMALERYQTEESGRNSNSTANRKLSTLKHMFTKAVDWEMVTEQVYKKVSKVTLLDEPVGRLRYLSKEECWQLVKECDQHVRPIVITAINTGMRRGEILNLKWEQVDLRHGFILLDKTKSGKRREVPINQTLRETLHSIPRKIADGTDNPYVFINPNTGKPFREVKKSFSSALRRAGIKDFRFHDLRHTYASLAVMAGIDLTTVKELLGHADIKMTLKYSHLAPAHKVAAAAKMDSIVNFKTSTQGEVDSLGGQFGSFGNG